MSRAALALAALLGCAPLGCAPGSAFCQWLEENNASAAITDGRGRSVDVCSKQQATDSADAVAPADAGAAPGFCDPSSPPSLDTACSACMKRLCCAELAACAPDATCICHAGVNTGADCTGSPPDAYAALSSCYASSCSACGRLP